MIFYKGIRFQSTGILDNKRYTTPSVMQQSISAEIIYS